MVAVFCRQNGSRRAPGVVLALPRVQQVLGAPRSVLCFVWIDAASDSFNESRTLGSHAFWFEFRSYLPGTKKCYEGRLGLYVIDHLTIYRWPPHLGGLGLNDPLTLPTFVLAGRMN